MRARHPASNGLRMSSGSCEIRIEYVPSLLPGVLLYHPMVQVLKPISSAGLSDDDLAHHDAVDVGSRSTTSEWVIVLRRDWIPE